METLTLREQLIYLAGLIDGEGHIGCQIYNKKPRPVIQLIMTDKETVDRFANFFGIKCRDRTSPSVLKDIRERGYKPTYVARAECHVAYKIIKQLEPYLFTKRKILPEVLNYYENRVCIVCKNSIPIEFPGGTKYCSRSCRDKGWKSGLSKPHKRKRGDVTTTPNSINGVKV